MSYKKDIEKNVLEGTRLYTIEEDAYCTSCGNKGAVKHFGKYYPSGLGDKAKDSIALKDYETEPFMSYAVGFGGTIPFRCMNCGNQGLIDGEGIEGYKKAFTKHPRSKI